MRGVSHAFVFRSQMIRPRPKVVTLGGIGFKRLAINEKKKNAIQGDGPFRNITLVSDDSMVAAPCRVFNCIGKPIFGVRLGHREPP